MLKSRLLVMLLFLLCAGGCSKDTNQPSSPATGEAVGRYQLINGEYSFLGRTAISQSHEVFKIDTITGKSWIFISYYDDKSKKTERFWRQIED